MLLRKVLVLPILTFGILSFFNLITGDFFHFYLWLSLALFAALIFAPIIMNTHEKTVPLIHVFGSMLVFIFFFSFATFFDFRVEKISFLESVFFGISVGTIIVAFIMLVKGK